MSARVAHVRLLRRVRRLLPIALWPVALLAAPGWTCWQASPLSPLWSRGGGRGVVGLRLQREVAAAIREQGAVWLLRARSARSDGAPEWAGWCSESAGDHSVFWCVRMDRRFAMRLDPLRESLWLFWRDPAREARHRCC